MSKDYLSEEYEDALLDLIRVDERLKDRFELLAYLPAYSYEVDTWIEDDYLAESFDVFKVLEISSGNEMYLSYSDQDNYRLSSLKTIMRYVKKCNVKK